MTRIQYANCREICYVGADYQHRHMGRNYHSPKLPSNLASDAEAICQQLYSEVETLLGCYYK